MIIKIPDKIRNILLPFFPEVKQFRNKLWYRALKLLIIINSFSCIYSIIWTLAVFFVIPTSFSNNPKYQLIDHIIYYPGYIPLNLINITTPMPIYGILFRASFNIPFLGPFALLAALTLIIYLLPGLLFRLILPISHNWHFARVKIIVLIALFGLGWLIFSTWEYQQLINAGSVIADQECLKVNPLIIARKNSFIKSVKIMQASGSADEYWAETDKYLDISDQFIKAQKSWLDTQKQFTSRWDYNFFVPSYIKEGGKFQYTSREADMESTDAVVQFFRTYKNLSQQEQNALTDKISKENSIRDNADNEYNKIDLSKKPFDLRDYFTFIPESKCPPENFNIPNVPDILNPQTIPVNSPIG